MKHHALEQLEIVAKVNRDYPRLPMSRRERLERWAELLEHYPHPALSTLREQSINPPWSARPVAILTDLRGVCRSGSASSRNGK